MESLAAMEKGGDIPTLCYHEALQAVGSCRLCIVEVEEKGRSRTAASCVTPLTPNMIISENKQGSDKSITRAFVFKKLSNYYLLFS